MRIVTVLGSPRKHGNTAFALDWVEQKLRSAGQSVQRINLIEHRIDPCRECLGCRKDNSDLCLNKSDDVDAILARLIDADLVLLASPVFCWGFPSILKALQDRMFCTVDDYMLTPEYQTRFQGKPMALLMTCGGPEEANAELPIRAFVSLVEFLKARCAGHLLFSFVQTVEDFTERDKQRAIEFAESLANFR